MTRICLSPNESQRQCCLQNKHNSPPVTERRVFLRSAHLYEEIKILIYRVHCFKFPILIGMYQRLWGKIPTQSLQLLNNPQHKGSYLHPNCSFRIWKPRFCQFSQQIGRYNGTFPFPTNTITDRKWCNVSRCFLKRNRTQTHTSVSRRNSFMQEETTNYKFSTISPN